MRILLKTLLESRFSIALPKGSIPPEPIMVLPLKNLISQNSLRIAKT